MLAALPPNFSNAILWRDPFTGLHALPYPMAEENSESTRSWNHPPFSATLPMWVSGRRGETSPFHKMLMVQCLSGMMVKAPRDTTEAAERYSWQRNLCLRYLGNCPKSSCLYVFERRWIGSPQEDEHGFNDNAISAYRLRIYGTSCCTKSFLAYSPSWVRRDWGSRCRAMHRMESCGRCGSERSQSFATSKLRHVIYGKRKGRGIRASR